MAAGLTEPAARAELAAGRALPLAWLWLLAGEKWRPVNERKTGKTMEVEIRTIQNEIWQG